MMMIIIIWLMTMTSLQTIFQNTLVLLLDIKWEKSTHQHWLYRCHQWCTYAHRPFKASCGMLGLVQFHHNAFQIAACLECGIGINIQRIESTKRNTSQVWSRDIWRKDSKLYMNTELINEIENRKIFKKTFERTRAWHQCSSLDHV